MYALNHICFSVSNLDTSIKFYSDVFGAKLLSKGKTTAYFNLNGLWIALNEEKDIPRNEIKDSYTHIAFSATKEEIERLYIHLQTLKVVILESRPRHERDDYSLYFEDPDGHKFEFHSGSLEKRLQFYKEEKPHIQFY